MNSTLMSQAWKIVKPHVPLIRFRKTNSDVNSGKVSPSTQAVRGPIQKSGHVVQQQVIEDYQLPLRYRRQPLSEKEIDAINSGGAY